MTSYEYYWTCTFDILTTNIASGRFLRKVDITCIVPQTRNAGLHFTPCHHPIMLWLTKGHNAATRLRTQWRLSKQYSTHRWNTQVSPRPGYYITICLLFPDTSYTNNTARTFRYMCIYTLRGF